MDYCSFGGVLILMSIVIPTTIGREGQLVSLMQSIAVQDKNSEIIIVSLDIDERIKDYICLMHDNVKFIEDARKGIGYAKQQGIDAASGEIIGLMDDDVVLNVFCLSRILRAFERGYRIVQPKIIFTNQNKAIDERESKNTGKLKWNLMCKYDWNMGSKNKLIDTCCETCFFFKKELMNEYKLYDKNLIGDAYGEDINFVLNLKEKVYFVPDAIAYHIEAISGGTVWFSDKRRNSKCNKQLQYLIHNMLYINHKYNSRFKYNLYIWYIIIGSRIYGMLRGEDCKDYILKGLERWLKSKQ